MTNVPSPTQQPELWDRCTIGGMRVPGVVRVSGGHSRRDDSEEVPGQDGVTTTILGYQPAEFTLDILLWGENDYNDYMAFYQKFRPRKTDPKAAQALKCEGHAAFILSDVKALTIYEITVPRHSHDQQYTASVRLREFIPQTTRKKGTKAGGKATGIKSTGADVSLVRGGAPPGGSPASLRIQSIPQPDPMPGFADTFPVEGF